MCIIARIKNIDTSGEPDPADPLDFRLSVVAHIGGEDSVGADLFYFTFCTPKWLGNYGIPSEGWDALRHFIVIERFEWGVIERALQDICDQASGFDTWEEVATRIGRFGQWEYEDIIYSQYSFDDRYRLGTWSKVSRLIPPALPLDEAARTTPDLRNAFFEFLDDFLVRESAALLQWISVQPEPLDLKQIIRCWKNRVFGAEQLERRYIAAIKDTGLIGIDDDGTVHLTELGRAYLERRNGPKQAGESS